MLFLDRKSPKTLGVALSTATTSTAIWTDVTPSTPHSTTTATTTSSIKSFIENSTLSKKKLAKTRLKKDWTGNADDYDDDEF